MGLGEEEQVVARVEKMGRLDEVLGEVLKLTKAGNVEKLLIVDSVFEEVMKLSSTATEKDCSEDPSTYHSRAMMPLGQHVKQEDLSNGFMDASFEENVKMNNTPAKSPVMDHNEGFRSLMGSTEDSDYSFCFTQFCHPHLMMWRGCIIYVGRSFRLARIHGHFRRVIIIFVGVVRAHTIFMGGIVL